MTKPETTSTTTIPPEPQTVFDSLEAAVTAMAGGDARRIYRACRTFEDDAGDTLVDERWVLATSPAAAALVVVGPDNVSLVSQRDRAEATRAALSRLLAEHNGKVAP